MRYSYIYFFLFISYFVVAQQSTVIIFNEQVSFDVKNLQEISGNVRKVIASDMKMARFKNILTYTNEKSYFSSSNETSVIKNKTLLENTPTKKVYSDEISFQPPKVKIYKNRLTNIIKKQSAAGNLNDIIIEKIKWKKIAKNKKILNYNCTLATTIFKGKPLEVYFTKEIKGIASPSIYPFIDGVILEYKTPTRHGIASDIKFNQPNIIEKDFFKS